MNNNLPQNSSWKARLTLFFKIIVILYLLIFGGLLALQRDLFYSRATHAPFQVLESLATQQGLQGWKEPGAAEPLGWKSQTADKPKCCFLLFHGNAKDALARAHYVHEIQALSAVVPSEIYLMEYPGYGWRQAKPSQSTLIEAAQVAFKNVRNQHPDIPLYLIGESLGSGVACQIAAQYPDQVAGMLLITPFNNLGSAAQSHLLIFPIHNLMLDSYRSDQALQKYHGPVAFLVAEEDRVVPPQLGQKLFEGYAGPKKLWMVPHAGHNTIPYASHQSWWQESFEFLLQH